MNADIDVAVRYLMTAAVDFLVYGCTSGSFTSGYGGEKEIARRIQSACGLPAVVTMAAVVDALRAFHVRRLMIASPYPEIMNQRLRDFLVAAGFSVLGVRVDPKASVGSRAMASEEPAEILEFAAADCAPGAELLLLPCTAWRSFEVAAHLEQSLGIPVVTANQATIWATLAGLGVVPTVTDVGSLFARPLPASEQTPVGSNLG